MVKINEGEGDLCEIVGVFKRKNYTRCIQIIIEYNSMYILSTHHIIQLIKSWKFMNSSLKPSSNKKRKEWFQEKRPRGMNWLINLLMTISFKSFLWNKSPYFPKFTHFTFINLKFTSIMAVISSWPTIKAH